MGQTLFEPPNVAGWQLGAAWFSTSAMLARMNFASALAANQRFNLARSATSFQATPEALLDFMFQRLSPAQFDRQPYDELLTYLTAGGPWTGSGAQVDSKTVGLVRLIVGAAEYQFV
jgi:hypothetical protein